MIDRRDLNIYLDSFLSLVPTVAEDKRREELILMSEACDSIDDLIGLWLWRWGLGQESLLRVKAWFGLPYHRLEEIFRLSSRQISKDLTILRRENLKLLREAFEISQLKSSHEFGGISCFVFEQSMSRWLDSEFEDFSQLPKFQEHLDKCHSCQSTLEAFRKGDKELYRSKQRYPVMSQREFDETKRRAQQQWRKARVKAAVFTFLIVGFLALIFYFLFQSHGPTPNVFEMRG